MNEANAFETLILIEDQPVPDHLTDELGVGNFSKMIAGIAKGTAGPFTIGVFGDWGHGKTSILKQARGLLDEDPDAKPDSRVVTVMFNAWQFEHEEHPIVPLVATIVQAVEKRLAEWQSIPDSVSDTAAAAFKSVARALRAIAYGFSAKAKVSIPGFADVEAGFVAKEMIERYDKLSTQSDPLLQRTLYYNAFEALDRAAGTDQSKNRPQHKIVVFIDDLDRCLPPQALKLLESIKLVLAQRGFIFVLAVDYRIIQGYMTHRYEAEFHVKDYPVGPSYLDKLVQLPLNLPGHRSRFSAYITKLLERPAMGVSSNVPVRDAIAKLIDVLAIGSNYNPRSLVRFINTLIVDRAIWAAMGEEVDTHLLGLCAVSRMLRQRLGDRPYDLLVHSDEVCQALLSGKTDELSLEGRSKPEHELSRRDQSVRELLRRLEDQEFLGELFKTDPGKEWLSNRDARQKVNEFLVQREQPPAEPTPAGSRIDQAIQESLKLPPQATITEAHRQTVQKLELGFTDTSDADLASVGNMRALRSLLLSGSKVTDAGLEHLKGLTSLLRLSLEGTKVTDAGLEHLKGLTSLQTLWLGDTKVTDAGLEHLKGLTSLQGLSLGSTQVTDAGLEHLKGLTSLQRLWLGGTKVTEAAVASLRAALPNLGILR